MTTDRFKHGAVLLPSGKMLVGGGEINNVRYGTLTAELYDPVAKSSSLAGVMRYGRIWHTLNLLPSGKVLAAGGDTASAELYRPDPQPLVRGRQHTTHARGAYGHSYVLG